MAGTWTEGPKARDAGATWQSERVPGKKCQKGEKNKEDKKKLTRSRMQTWMERQWAQRPLGKKKAKVKCEMLNLGQVTLACAIVSTSQTATLQQHYDNSLQHPLCAPSVWTFGLCCLHPCVHKFLFILFLFLPLLTLIFQAP